MCFIYYERTVHQNPYLCPLGREGAQAKLAWLACLSTAGAQGSRPAVYLEMATVDVIGKPTARVNVPAAIINGEEVPRKCLSQISGVRGSLGLAANFVPLLSEAARDPECDCREAEASVQGRLVG
jgi:hypothetical protein